MALATKCPHCNTIFRVAADQLKLRGGIVRCGSCKEVFDGNATLLDPDAPYAPVAVPAPAPYAPVAEPEPAIAAGEAEPDFDLDFDLDLDHAAPAAEPEPPGPDSVPVLQVWRARPPSAALPAPLPAASRPAHAAPPAPAPEEIDEYLVATEPRDAGTAEAIPAAVAQFAPEAAADETAIPAPDTEAAQAEEEDATAEAEEPGFVRQGRRRQRTGKALRMAMATGSLLLLAGLLAQGMANFRNQLAVQLPQLKPALQAICAAAGCRIDLPSQIDALAVEQGELQIMGERTFSYATVLHNQGGSAQSWPSLELTLNDASDKPLLRRVFAPRDYLPQTVEIDQGFPARSEQAIKLYFELTQLKASGYHIAVFYP